MRISNKNLIIVLLTGIAILISWSWLNQSGFLNRNNTPPDSEIEENENQVVNDSLTDSPRLQITFPENAAILNPSPLIVRYTISGNLEEVERVDLTLFKENEIFYRQQGSFSKINRTGSQMFPKLEVGEYRLMARLIKSDNTYFESHLAEAIVTFRIKDPNKEE